MARKQLGMVDDELLGRVDAAAGRLGQTRRVFAERALEVALAGPGPKASNAEAMTRRAERAASPRTSAPGTVAKGRQPTASHPRPASVPIAAATLGKGTFKPIPKGGKG